MLQNIRNEAELNRIVYGQDSLYINTENSIAYLKLKKLPSSVKKYRTPKTLSEFLKYYIELLEATQCLHKKRNCPR